MPLCLLHTNLKEDQIPDGFETRLAETIAKVLKKDLERVSVFILPTRQMYRWKTSGSGCYLRIHSIGVFDKERNLGYTPPIMDFLKKELMLSGDRIMIHYEPAEMYQFGQEAQ